jgi:glycosyltransferase involved in cell wall biosynthesis
MPLVSVVIPTYNYARYLPEAIDSALAQTFTDREIIVIDDGSTDDTAQVVRRFGDRVIYEAQVNAGLPAARNRGCALARGEYLAFLDADDVWMPDKLERQLRTLRENPTAVMVCGMMNRIDIDGKPLQGIKPGLWPGETAMEMLERGTALPSTWVVRRSCFERTGGFDPNLTAMEDYEFAIRVANDGRVICLPGIFANYRVHADSFSHQTERFLLGYLQVFEKLLGVIDDRAMRRLMRCSQARYRYRLAKTRLAKGDFGSARRLIVEALCSAPALAWSGGESMPSWRRTIRVLRPYGVLLGLCIAPGVVRDRVKAESSY